MSILRNLLLLILAAFFAGCAAHIPVLETQDNVSTTTAQPDRTLTATVKSEAKMPKLPAPQTATISTTSHEDNTIKSTTPNVGSPQKWEKERAEDERREQHLKQVIEGICRGC